MDRHLIEHCTHLDALTAAVRATGPTLPVGTDADELTSVYLFLVPGVAVPVASLIEV